MGVACAARPSFIFMMELAELTAQRSARHAIWMGAALAASPGFTFMREPAQPRAQMAPMQSMRVTAQEVNASDAEHHARPA